MRLVIALGGNALLRRGEKADATAQLDHVSSVSGPLARAASQHDVVICHGDVPQVGLLSLESEADTSLTRPYPLDVLGAQSQGMIGYWRAEGIRDAGLAGPIVSVVTQTVVDAGDPAFTAPTKLIGRTFDRDQAPDRWRRVVASPEPVDIIAVGSMGPKVEACRRFVATTGRRASLSSLVELDSVLASLAGITVTEEDSPQLVASGAPSKPSVGVNR